MRDTGLTWMCAKVLLAASDLTEFFLINAKDIVRNISIFYIIYIWI